MITPADIRRRAEQLWRSGTVLRARLGVKEDTARFPASVRYRKPSGAEWLERFEVLRGEIRTLAEHCRDADGFGYAIEWKTWTHRKLGEQRVPDGVILERPEDAIAVLGKEEDAESFLLAAREITAAFPKLEAWVHRKPLKVIEHCGEWTRVLSVLRFVCDHPRPQLFCRQLELPGVDTKFIEGRQRLLAELFDCLLPPDAIEESAPLRREAWFEHRYGFLYDPPRIRFRLLDPALREQTPFEDCSVPLSGLARHPIASRVFIVENQISGLAFPDVPGSAVIFGLGYGVGMLRGVDWLRQIPVHYWGDLDTHGFAILARVRSFLPQARSLLMDRETLFAYRDRWGEETKRASLDDTAAACLTVDEQRALAALDPGAGQSGLRLEQEQIPISAVRRALNHLGLFDVSGPAV